MIDQVQEVKDRVDIVEIISSYLTVKKAGTNYKACCPFHNEKSPSFMISPERQTFKCFGCSEGGDVISFVEKMEGLDFYNALKLLAEKAGVKLKNDSVKYGEKNHSADTKTRIFEINEWTKKIYQKILLDHPKAEKAREYLKKRGMTLETMKDFEIGYAPDSWDFILRFLNSKGYTDAEAVLGGVAIKSEKGKIFDRFRGRIVFPINNIMGNTIAFTSRIIEERENEAKYINSAESSIYTKGKTIYGLDKAKMAIKEADLAILVEGNMDVIACHQAGFKNVVAVSGTALTLEQLTILSRYASQIAYCFDADNAGQTAMKRAIRIALQNDFSTRVISLPKPFKDPDEAIKADPENWVKVVKNAKPSLEFWINQLIEKNPEMTIIQKKQIAKEILPEIKIIFSEIEKEHYIKYLAQKLGVSHQSLSAALTKSKVDQEFSKNREVANFEAPEKLSALERVFGILWSEPKLIDAVAIVLDMSEVDPKFQSFAEMIENKAIDKSKIKPEIANFYDQNTILALENVNPSVDGSVREELTYLLGRLKSDQKEDLKETFARKIRDAEEAGDKEGVKKLLAEFASLIK